MTFLIAAALDVGVGTQIVDQLMTRETERQFRKASPAIFPQPTQAVQFTNPEFVSKSSTTRAVDQLPGAAFTASTLTTSPAQANLANMGMDAPSLTIMEPTPTRGALWPAPGRGGWTPKPS